jgi:hypothetical protein
LRSQSAVSRPASARQTYWLELERERVTRWEAALDQTALDVAGMLDAGPDDDDSVLALFQAGALPMAAPLVFPGVDFGDVDPKELYENVLKSGRIPDLESLSDQELDEWLRNHPAEADQLQVVLAITGPLSPDQERVARALGRYEAWQVERDLSGAAPFLAAATVIVYAGAIVVTFVFVIMLAQQEGMASADQRSRERPSETAVESTVASS